MERRLAAVAATTGVAMLALLVALVALHSDNSAACLTLDCVESSADVTYYVDRRADPCDDFYQFACGGFLRDPEGSIGTRDVADGILANEIREMIEAPADAAADPRPLARAKAFYRGCTNATGADARALKTLEDALRETGGWPVLDAEWKAGNFDWKRVAHKLRRIGYAFDLFLGVEVAVDPADGERYIVELKPPDSRRLELNDRFRDLHLAYVVDIATLLGAPRNRAERDAKDLLEFQDGLRKVVERHEERNNNSYIPKTISKLHYEDPSVPWFHYVNDMLWPGANVTVDETILVPDVQYIKELLSLLHKAQKRVIANFMGWRFVDDLIEYLPKKLRNEKIRYYYLTKKQPLPPKWELCLKTTADVMLVSLKELYAYKHVSKRTREFMEEMIYIIRKRFDKQIDNFDWLDQEASKIAKIKIASLIRSIAEYNEIDIDDTIYENTEIREDKFLASLLELKRAKRTFDYSKLRRRVATYHARADHGMYDIKENKLAIPVDYLHGIYYAAARPAYANYGALGGLVARDLSNMFLEGQFVDARGSRREWLVSENLYVYNNRTRCFGRRGVKFYVPEIKRTVNTSYVKLEDVSVVAGFKYAYEAYSSWVNSNGLEAGLPGIAYTPKQLFWIFAAVPYCQKDDEETVERALRERAETLDKIKVNYALRNLPEFAEAFDCPRDSKMNPEEKCEMW